MLLHYKVLLRYCRLWCHQHLLILLLYPNSQELPIGIGVEMVSLRIDLLFIKISRIHNHGTLDPILISFAIFHFIPTVDFAD